MEILEPAKQDVFSIKSAARDFFGGQVSEWSLRTWIRLGRLRAYKAGSRVLLKREDLEAVFQVRELGIGKGTLRKARTTCATAREPRQ